jgi:arginyl-tRNA synthetase
MIYPLNEFKNEIILQLKEILSSIECEIKLETPPEDMGDFAFPCFQLASVFKKSPKDIAIELSKKIKVKKWIKKSEGRGGYVNFFVNDSYLISSTLTSIFKMKGKYGHLQKKNKKVIIEHTSANPNGPLHVGRARNPIIGDTLVRLFKAAGYNVESQFYLDDMGKQVAILTWGLRNLDVKQIPKSKFDKPDHQHVGFYQVANKLMRKDGRVAYEISEIVKQSEQGDSQTIEMVQQSYKKVLDGINGSLERINIFLDKYVPESTFVRDKSVETIIEKLKKTRYCFQEDGAFYLDLNPFGIQGRNTKFFFLRKDGTSLYATRDIAYHQWKARHADLLINVLGEDHKLESKQVEIALKLLNIKRLPQTLFYAFVSLPGGKMSTRQARVVYLDELIDECIKRAYFEVKKRRGDELSDHKMKKIAQMVGIGALRYNIIKVQPEKEIIFRWEDALNFEGNAIPFIQYAHARACSILIKNRDQGRDFHPNTLNHVSEISLIKQLAKFPITVDEASTNYKPHILANYLFETASKFNQFYRDCPVLSEKDSLLGQSRITLVDATRIVLHNALELLGIPAPEEM